MIITHRPALCADLLLLSTGVVSNSQPLYKFDASFGMDQ